MSCFKGMEVNENNLLPFCHLRLMAHIGTNIPPKDKSLTGM